MSEYSLPEGVIISALLQPDVDINIEVSTGAQTQRLTVSNATSIMALKVQICGVMRCGVTPERLELRLGETIMEDPMPLHFYAIKNASKINVIKPWICVTVLHSKMGSIFSQMNRNDTIRILKARLLAIPNFSPITFQLLTDQPINPLSNQRCFRPASNHEFTHVKGTPDPFATFGSRLYLVSEGKYYVDLDDNETVETLRINDGDELYLLTTRWTKKEVDVREYGTGRKIRGVEPEHTGLDIRLRAQDQTGLPVSDLLVFSVNPSSGYFNMGPGQGYQGVTHDQTPQPIRLPSGALDEKLLLYVIPADTYNAEQKRIREEMKQN